MRMPRHIDVPKATTEAPRNLTRTIGTNLRRLRTGRGLSLGQLARVSGVSRAMLGQIELGQSTPTVNVVSKIASALAVPFVTLIGEEETGSEWTVVANGSTAGAPRASLAKAFSSWREHAGWAQQRAAGDPRALVFYEVRLAPFASLGAGLAPAEGGENVLVVEGRVALLLAHERYELGAGDVIFFEANAPYEYRNDGELPARLYVVMTHERAARWLLV